MEFLSELMQQFYISFSALAKCELGADTNGADSAEIDSQSLNERLGRDFAHGFIEGKDQGGVHAQGADGFEALIE